MLRRKIYLIDRAVHHHIKTAVISGKRKPVHILFQQFRRFCVGDKNHLLYHILAAVIVIDLHTILTFVVASVHIAIYDKLHISGLIHIQHLDLMSVIYRTSVAVVLVLKAEQKSQLVIRHIVRKQSVSHHKSENITSVALRQPDLLRPLYPQGYLIVIINLFFLVKQLGHFPLKIKQIHAVRGIPYPVIFRHKVLFLSALIRNLHLITHLIGCSLRHHLLDIHNRLRRLLHRQISPCHLIPAAVDIHSAESTVIAVLIGFQIHREIFFHIRFVESILVKPPDKLRLLPYMIIFSQQDPGIIADIPPGIKAKDDNKIILSVLLQQILHHEIRCEQSLRLLKIRNFGILDQTASVAAPDLIGDRLYACPKFFHRNAEISAVLQRRYRITHMRGIHLIPVTVKAVYKFPRNIHIDKRIRRRRHLRRHIRVPQIHNRLKQK